VFSPRGKEVCPCRYSPRIPEIINRERIYQ